MRLLSIRRAAVASLLCCIAACSSNAQEPSLTVREAFPKLSFTNPVDFQHASDGSNKLFVVEQGGMIRVFENSPSVESAEIFLDIHSRITSGNELGLLGLAFHPNFEENGYFYVNYTAPNPLRTVIARYKVSADNPQQADPNSETVLLEYNQPFPNHNGGQVAFGPDGYLYIAAGDGGSGGDPQGNGQTRSTLLGKILRIDVDHEENGKNYAIPPDNPFAGNTSDYREEIYAYGLRNPWRFSFDPATGKLWAGDVGQGAWEEVDIIEKGGNYGWNIMEGKHCYPPGTKDCDTSGLILPVWEYDHSLGVSITGGYVYRGSRLSELVGEYIYADFGSGRIWGLRYDDMGTATNRLLISSGLTISSFGVDAAGELYFCSFNGKIYTFDSPLGGVTSADKVVSATLLGAVPNPFSDATAIQYLLKQAGHVHLTVCDLLGNVVATLVDAVQPVGTHQVQFDALQYAAGTYTYILSVDGSAGQQGRMVLKR